MQILAIQRRVQCIEVLEEDEKLKFDIGKPDNGLDFITKLQQKEDLQKEKHFIQGVFEIMTTKKCSQSDIELPWLRKSTLIKPKGTVSLNNDSVFCRTGIENEIRRLDQSHSHHIFDIASDGEESSAKEEMDPSKELPPADGNFEDEIGPD